MRFFEPLNNLLHRLHASRKLSKGFSDALCTRDGFPNDRDIFRVLSSAPVGNNAAILKDKITSLSLQYTPPPQAMQTLADVSSPMGNSMYSKSSTAGMKEEFHGLQVFKALYLLHRLIDQSPESVYRYSDDYIAWIDSLTGNHEERCLTEKGHRKLALRYLIYLRERLLIQTVFQHKDQDAVSLLFLAPNSNVVLRNPSSEGEEFYKTQVKSLTSALRRLRDELAVGIAQGNPQKCVSLVFKTVVADIDTMEAAL